MKEAPTKQNTLYLPIKQIYFDQIIAGTKKEEYREVKFGTTANRYLQQVIGDNGKPVKEDDGVEGYVRNPETTDNSVDQYFVDDYNAGKFPFLPRPYKYLHLAVGYNKVRDEAIVEVVDITFKVGATFDGDGYKGAIWIIVYHLGTVVKLERQKKHE